MIVRNEYHSLTFQAFFGGVVPGFEVFEGDPKNQRIVLDVIKKKITHNLGMSEDSLSLI